MSERTRSNTTRWVFLCATAVALLAFGYYLRPIFNPLLLALLIAYVLNPIITHFEKLKISRTLSIVVLYIAIIAGLVFLVASVVPVAWTELAYFCTAAFEGDDFKDNNGDKTFSEGDVQTTDLNRNKKYDPSYVDSLVNWAKEKVENWNKNHPDRKIDFNDILDRLKKSAQDNWREVTSAGIDVTAWIAGAVSSGISGLFFVLSYLVLVPVYAFFLLRGMNRMKAIASDHLPASHKERILTVVRKIDIAISSFFRGKLIICLFKGVLAGIGLYIVGVRFSLLFGFVVAVAALVPYAVVVIGWIPAMLLVFLESGADWWLLGGTLFVFLTIEALESIVLTPLVLGKETGLHPMTVIVSLFVGGELFGLFGVILSIPLTCIAKILAQELLLPHLKALSAKPPADERMNG